MVKDKKKASKPPDAEFIIAHAVEGRVRLLVRGDDVRELLVKIAAQIKQQAGILSVQIKPNSNSLVINFEPKIVSREQLINFLHSCGWKISNIEETTKQSQATNYRRILSLIPPLVGLAIARGLQVSGWKSILTYILATGLTREVITQATGEESMKSSPAIPKASLSSTEIIVEEISSLLIALETDFEVVHHIPGRIRLRIPRISRDHKYGEELKQLLEQDERVTQVKLKPNSASVVILYQLQTTAQSQLEETASLNGSKPQNLILVEQKVQTPTDATITSETTQPTITEQPETTKNTGYWSNFKSSMMLMMLKLLGNLPVATQTVET